jgi:uncharacterized protein (DUF2147 family)
MPIDIVPGLRCLLLAVAALTCLAAASPDAALGRWQTQTHHGVVVITACGSSICGQLVTSPRLAATPTMQDANNPTPALRQRRLIGLTILQGFHRTKDGWAGGAIYNPDDGKTYHARVTPIDADHLRVRGCIFIPFCQSQVWTRLR